MLKIAPALGKIMQQAKKNGCITNMQPVVTKKTQTKN